jgi:arsenite/tail-anchored protein-transporting ATPase
MYEERNPADVLFLDDPLTITKRGESYVLTLSLPFARKEELELSTKNDELFLRVGPYRRTIMLPRVLTAREVTSARLVGSRIEVVFERGLQR